MQVTGRITGLQPTQRGGYNGRNGYIYTFDMTIDTPNGQILGEIGSKSQNYPKNTGDEITVEVKQDGQYGNKFKAVNPQYGNQGQPQQGRQQPQQSHQSQQQTYHPVEKKEPDWDLKDFRIILQCCSKPFAEAQAAGKITYDEAVVNMKSWANEIWRARPLENPMNEHYDPADTEPDWMQEP